MLDPRLRCSRTADATDLAIGYQEVKIYQTETKWLSYKMLLSADYVSVRCFQVLYDLVGSAKLNAVDPEAYLLQAPIRIADHPINRIEELLPWDLAVILPELATKKEDRQGREFRDWPRAAQHRGTDRRPRDHHRHGPPGGSCRHRRG